MQNVACLMMMVTSDSPIPAMVPGYAELADRRTLAALLRARDKGSQPGERVRLRVHQLAQAFVAPTDIATRNSPFPLKNR